MADYKIREAKAEDAEGSLKHNDDIAKEPDVNLPSLPGESRTSLEDQEKFITECRVSDNSRYFIATSNEKLIGELTLAGGKIPANQHRATLGMTVSREWRWQGTFAESN